MKKIKLFIESEQGKNLLTVIIIILTSLGSFELGRLSKEGNNGGIKIEYSNREPQNLEKTTVTPKVTQTVPKITNSTNLGVKNFFASNRGSKYYPVACSAGKTIKLENRIYFATREEAERAGYELSASCQ